MNAAWQFVGSLAAVAALVALTWRFGFSGLPRLDGDDEARAIARGLHGGFDAVAVALDRGGHAALLRDSRGRIALVRPHGAHFLAELLGPHTTASTEGETIVIALERHRIALEIGTAVAADWAEAIDRLE